MYDLPKTLDELNSALTQLANKSSDEISELVEKGGYLISNSVATPELITPPIAAGWKLHVTVPHNLELPRVVFISATTPHNRLLWERGQATIARNAGLNEISIMRWMKCNNKHKYRFLDLLVYIQNTPVDIEGYLQYSDTFTNEQYHEWSIKYNIHDKLSPKARVNFVEIVKYVLV